MWIKANSGLTFQVKLSKKLEIMSPPINAMRGSNKIRFILKNFANVDLSLKITKSAKLATFSASDFSNQRTCVFFISLLRMYNHQHKHACAAYSVAASFKYIIQPGAFLFNSVAISLPISHRYLQVSTVVNDDDNLRENAMCEREYGWEGRVR